MHVLGICIYMYTIIMYMYMSNMVDTLLSGVVSKETALLGDGGLVDRLQLLRESCKPSRCLRPQSRQLLLLTQHQLVELGEVGMVRHAH